jgi:uncharacterized membrane protein YqiK
MIYIAIIIIGVIVIIIIIIIIIILIILSYEYMCTRDGDAKALVTDFLPNQDSKPSTILGMC